jgi:hypothetical protein
MDSTVKINILQDGYLKISADYLSKDALFMFGECVQSRLRSSDGCMLFQVKYYMVTLIVARTKQQN